LSLHQLDFCSSRYWILNDQRSIVIECEIWLWRMWFLCSLSFYFSWLRYPEIYGCYLSNATGITLFWLLELTLCTKHLLRVKSANYLQFTPFCIFHPKVPSKHQTKNIKAFYINNIGKTLVKCEWNYRIIWLHQVVADEFWVQCVSRELVYLMISVSLTTLLLLMSFEVNTSAVNQFCW
jgi:hypothetical protein